MIFEKSKEKTLSKELFQNPTSEYRGEPFWSWNCKVTEELVDKQMEIYKEMGMGGFTIHARTGLETPYMGEEFLNLIARCNEWAKENNMLCYLYDEDRYASGAAGGLVTENVRYRQRFLLLSRKLQTELAGSREEYESAIDRGEKPKGYYVTSYWVKLSKDGYLLEYKRLSLGEAKKLNEKLQENSSDSAGEDVEKVWYAYVKLAKESPWFNDQTYIDVFNKKAVERFIEVTHERYYEKVGEDFGKSIPSIFTDEPQMAGKFAFSTPLADKDATLSYTDDMNETFQAATGTELLDIVPEVLWELPDGAVSVYRYRYHDHLAERFAESFPDTISKWCGEHNLAMTGHFMSERTLYSQTLALSDAMRLYRNMQIPGIDILTDAKEFTTAKQAVSVARQQGREGVTSEEYGATHWYADFKTYKLQGDWQAALGVTNRVHHLTFMSMEGESKRDWPASIGYQSPWYQKHAYLEDHFARVNTALTRGIPSVNLAVIYPIESYWIFYGPNSQTQELRDQLDQNYACLMEDLLYGTVDFDLICEGILPSQCADMPTDGRLHVGQMTYQTVLVPDLRTIRSTTLERLEALAESGGTVIFAGNVPRLVDAKPSDRAVQLAEKCKCIQFNRAELLEALQETREVEIRDGKGKLSTNLIYQMRNDGDGKWLFICHVNRKRNILDKHEKYYIRVKGTWNPVLYDTITGEIKPIKGVKEDNVTMIKAHLFAEDSLLLYLEPKEPEMVEEKQERKTVAHEIEVPVSYELDEPNSLLLDYAEYKFDDGDWQEKKDILTIDNEFRLKLGLPRRQDKFTQPWRIPNVPTENTAYLRFTFDSDIEVKDAKLAMERPEKARILLNGEEQKNQPDGYYVDEFIKTVPLSGIKKGINELLLEIPFGRKENLEWCYILGDFGVEVYGDYAHIVERQEKLRFGDITRQTLPFYTGNVTYHLETKLDEAQEEVILQVPHFEAAVLEVFADGESRGLIAYAPHKLSLGAMGAGVHKIDIVCYGNRFNGFGTLHNANDEYRWYGPDAYRAGGTEWSDSYLVRPAGILSRVKLLY